MLNSPQIRSLLAGVAGFVAYGSWAVYANWAHGETIALRSGLVQGSYSFVLTWVMTLVTEWLFTALADVAYKVPLLMAIICTTLFATAYAINYAAGTPEILMTILPGFMIGSIYTLVYVLGLRRQVVQADRAAAVHPGAGQS